MKDVEPIVSAFLGEAWAGSSVNCTTYRCEGVFSYADDIFGCFYTSSGKIRAFKRRVWSKDGEFGDIETTEMPFDAHYSPSMGIDRSERLHLFAGSHVSRPAYYRSSGLDVGTFTDCSSELAEALADLTYPTLLRERAGNSLWLLGRTGRPDRSAILARRWDDETGKWEAGTTTIVNGRVTNSWAAGPYLNTPIVFPDGRIGVPLVWRTSHVCGSRNAPMNIGVDYFEATENFRIFQTRSGVKLSKPVTPAISERVVAVQWGSDLCNQAGGAATEDGLPIFVAAWREPGEICQIYLIWADAHGRWRRRRVTSFSVDARMAGGGTLAMPNSRPSVVGVRGGVIVLYRSLEMGGLFAQPLCAPDYDPAMHPPILLWPDDLGFYEPVVDRTVAPEEDRLTLYVQSCMQIAGGDRTENFASAPAYLASWRVTDLFRAKAPGVLSCNSEP